MKNMKPPTKPEITAYCKERGIPVSVVDPESFHVWYEEQEPPWSVPTKKKSVRRPMTSWKISVHTWKRMAKDTTSLVNVKKREQKYIKEKKEQFVPRKKVKANPEIKKLADKYYTLGKAMRNASPLLQRSMKRQRALLVKDMQKLKDDDGKLGNIIINKA